MVIYGIGFARCHSDHSVFVRFTKSGSGILVVYVDDILLTGSDCGLNRNKGISQVSFYDE